MKKLIFTITAAGLITAGILTGCNSPSKKVEKAQENLEEAKQEYSRSQKDSIADYDQFRRESEEKISNNEKAIEAYKARMATEKKHLKAQDQKAIDELEQKNINMRKKMEEYRAEGKDEWASFKTEFSHDMDELGSAIKGLTVKNTK